MESLVQKNAVKRSRSADDDDANNNLTQRKVWVNQKMSDTRDPQKMKEVHGMFMCRIIRYSIYAPDPGTISYHKASVQGDGFAVKEIPIGKLSSM